MALAEKLEMLISVDPSQGIRGFEAIAKSAEANTKQVESSIGRIGATVAKIGAAGFGIGGFLTQMASSDVEAANQLEAAVNQVGGSMDDIRPKVDAAIDAMAKFGHTDGEVTNATTTLTLAYGDANVALDKMQLVADLAARKHISLEAAASMVAKAHGGAAKLFREFGIQVDENADGTKNYDGALSELAGKLSGQAAASADTFGGKLSALRAEVENQVSAFGEKYGPAIMAAGGAMTVLGSATSGVSSLLGKFGKDVSAAQVGATAFGAAFGVAAVAGLYAFGQSLNKTTLDAEELQTIMSKTGPEASAALDEIHRASVGPFTEMFPDALKKIADSGDAGIGILKQYRDHLASLGQDTTAVDTVLRQAADAQAAMNANQEAGKTTTEQLDAAYKKLHDTIHAGLDPVFALQNALLSNTETQNAAVAASMNAKVAQDEYNAAVAAFGPNSDQATVAGLKLAEANHGLDEANVKAGQSALGLTDAAGQLSLAMEKNPALIAGVKATLDELAATGAINRDVAEQLSGKLGILTSNLDALDGRHINFDVYGHLHVPTAGLDINAYKSARGSVVHAYAGGGIEAHVARGTTLMYAEPSTGGEAFIPRLGNRQRNLQILDVAAGWNDAMVVKKSAAIPRSMRRAVPRASYPAAWMGGETHVHVHVGQVIGNDLREAARQLAQPIRRELLKHSGRNPAGVEGLL